MLLLATGVSITRPGLETIDFFRPATLAMMAEEGQGSCRGEKGGRRGGERGMQRMGSYDEYLLFAGELAGNSTTNA